MRASSTARRGSGKSRRPPRAWPTCATYSGPRARRASQARSDHGLRRSPRCRGQRASPPALGVGRLRPAGPPPSLACPANALGALVIADTMTQWSEEETAWALRQSERPGPEFANPGEAGARYRLSPPETAATAERLRHLGEAAVVERAAGVWQYAFDRKVFAQARPDAWPILPKIACPTLAVRGEGSGIMDRAAMLRVATTVP